MARLIRQTDEQKDIARASTYYWLGATILLFAAFLACAAFPPLFIVWFGGLIYAFAHWQTRKQQIRDAHAAMREQRRRK